MIKNHAIYGMWVHKIAPIKSRSSTLVRWSLGSVVETVAAKIWNLFLLGELSSRFFVNVVIFTTYIPQFHSPQIYTHREAAGFHWSPAASFVLCLCASRMNEAVWNPLTACQPDGTWRMYCRTVFYVRNDTVYWDDAREIAASLLVRIRRIGFFRLDENMVEIHVQRYSRCRWSCEHQECRWWLCQVKAHKKPCLRNKFRRKEWFFRFYVYFAICQIFFIWVLSSSKVSEFPDICKHWIIYCHPMTCFLVKL